MIPILQELSKNSLVCRLDTPPANGIPDDLQVGSYRWCVYVYSNVEKENLTDEEHSALIQASEKIRDEHLICWTRERLFDYQERDAAVIREYLNGVLSVTRSAKILRFCIYMLRLMNTKMYLIDSEILKHLPKILHYME